MAGTSIFFQGRVVRTPSSVAIVDASQLQSVGLQGGGRQMLIGEGLGGRPVKTMTKLDDFTILKDESDARKIYRSGDLREAGVMAFSASLDDDIPRAPIEVVTMQVRPDDPSSVILSNALGQSIEIDSTGYGSFTEQINVSVDDGELRGKLLTVVFEDEVDTENNVGGKKTGADADEPIFEILYTPASTIGLGWEEMMFQVRPGGVLAATGYRSDNGQKENVSGGGPFENAFDVGTQVDTGTVVTVTASSGEDAALGHKVQVYGLDTADVAVRELIAIPNTGTVNGVQTWNKVLGAVILDAAGNPVAAAAATGGGQTVIISARQGSDPTNIFSFVHGGISKAVILGSTMYSTGQLYLGAVGGGSGQSAISIWGRTRGGQAVKAAAVVTDTDVGAALTDATTFYTVDAIVVGDAPTARSLRLWSVAAATDPAVQTTLQKAADYFNARSIPGDPTVGFTFTIDTAVNALSVAKLDWTADLAKTTDGSFGAGVSILTTQTYFAELQAMIDWYDTGSDLVDAVRVPFGPRVATLTLTYGANTLYNVMLLDGETVTTTATTDLATTAAALAAQINAWTHDSVHDISPIPRVVRATASGGVVTVTGRIPVNFAISVFPSGEGSGTITLTYANEFVLGTGNVPANQGPVFLSGGSSSTAATISDYLKALELALLIQVDHITVLTGNPAIQKALDTHINLCCGIYNLERDGSVGLSALDEDSNVLSGAYDDDIVLPDKASIRKQIQALNTKNLRAYAQKIRRFDSNGDSKWFAPWFQATVGGAMSVGGDIGTSETNKIVNVEDVDQDSSWNPVRDSEEQIKNGLNFWRLVEGKGIKCVRDITTYLKSDNIAYTEASTNQAVNFATFNLRDGMEESIGKKGFAGTLAAAKTAAIGRLDLLVRNIVITSWRALLMSIIRDILEMAVQLAPVTPVNFAISNIHLTAFQLQAAA